MGKVVAILILATCSILRLLNCVYVDLPMIDVAPRFVDVK